MENTFKLLFAIIWLVYFAARYYFQRRIKRTLEYTCIDKRREKLFFSLFALAFILLPLYSVTSWFDFYHISLPLSLRWSGVVIALAGVMLFCWAHQILGNNWTAVLARSNEHELVRSGPYRVIRHPMYLAFFTIGIGFGLISENYLIAALYVIPLTAMYSARVKREETMLIEKFGDSYREYMKKTGRVFPRIWK